MEVGASGLVAAGLQVFLNFFRWDGGLGLEARAGLVFAPIKDDRTHLGAANGSDGLRERSAGDAAEMVLLNGHWNKWRPCRKHFPGQVFILSSG